MKSITTLNEPNLWVYLQNLSLLPLPAPILISWSVVFLPLPNHKSRLVDDNFEASICDFCWFWMGAAFTKFYNVHPHEHLRKANGFPTWPPMNGPQHRRSQVYGCFFCLYILFNFKNQLHDFTASGQTQFHNISERFTATITQFYFLNSFINTS